MQRVIVQADRASRMNADDILNYNVKNSRGQLVPFSAFATVQWSKGPTQIAGFNYYPAVRISRRSQARLHLRRRHRRDGAARGQAAARLRFRMDRAVAAGKAVGLAGAVPARPLGAGGVPAARRALRELDHSARGAADGAARHLRRGDRRHDARPAERRLFHRRPDHHHRPGGKGRHPHHRVRQGSARAGQAAGRGDDRSLLACASARS